MTVILKLGGSLLATGRELMHSLREYEFARTARQLVIVPGGGHFAESVRELQMLLGFSDETAHWMAVLAMHQYGLFLANGAPETPVLERLEDLRTTRAAGLCILLPYHVLRADDTLPHTWKVTSDTIAAFIAQKLGETTFIKVTDVDGLLDATGALIDHIQARELLEIEHTGCIDAALPQFLLEHGMSCVIVNGHHPERVIAAIEGRATICTRIE